MKYKKINLFWIFSFFGFLFFIIIVAWLKPLGSDSPWIQIVIIISGLLYGAIFKKIINKPFLISKYEFNIPKDYKDPLRVSCSSLVRIYIHGKYFLVKQKNKTGKFVPVGGAYKHFLPEFSKYGFVKDGTGEQNDLKLVGKLKNLPMFLTWFNSKNVLEREINPHKEIRKKLFDTGIFDEKEFGKITPSYLKTIYKNNAVAFSPHYKKYELIIFEIFNLVLTKNQVELFEKTMKIESDKYKFIEKSDLKCNDKEQYIFADNVEYIFIQEDI
jgi:hypothetical protein